jgi:hypothetical protein
LQQPQQSSRPTSDDPDEIETEILADADENNLEDSPRIEASSGGVGSHASAAAAAAAAAVRASNGASRDDFDVSYAGGGDHSIRQQQGHGAQQGSHNGYYGEVEEELFGEDEADESSAAIAAVPIAQTSPPRPLRDKQRPPAQGAVPSQQQQSHGVSHQQQQQHQMQAQLQQLQQQLPRSKSDDPKEKRRSMEVRTINRANRDWRPGAWCVLRLCVSGDLAGAVVLYL